MLGKFVPLPSASLVAIWRLNGIVAVLPGKIGTTTLEIALALPEVIAMKSVWVPTPLPVSVGKLPRFLLVTIERGSPGICACVEELLSHTPFKISISLQHLTKRCDVKWQQPVVVVLLQRCARSNERSASVAVRPACCDVEGCLTRVRAPCLQGDVGAHPDQRLNPISMPTKRKPVQRRPAAVQLVYAVSFFKLCDYRFEFLARLCRRKKCPLNQKAIFTSRATVKKRLRARVPSCTVKKCLRAHVPCFNRARESHVLKCQGVIIGIANRRSGW